MGLKKNMNLDIKTQCINGHEWPIELIDHTKPLYALKEMFDRGELLKMTKSFKTQIPIVITLLSKEYLNVGKIWLSQLNQSDITQYIIFTADKESKLYLDTLNVPNCSLWIKEVNQNAKPYLSKTGFSEKGLSITAFKFPLVKELLKLNFHVLLMDIDAILLSTPPFDFFSSFDLCFQRVFYFPRPIANVWGFAACSGFVWFKSTPKSISFINNAIEEQTKVYSDQIAMNIALWESNIRWFNPFSEKQQELLTFKEDERISFFIYIHDKEIIGTSLENGLNVCALSTRAYWRNDFVPANMENVILFHPNSPKDEIGKLEIFKKFGFNINSNLK